MKASQKQLLTNMRIIRFLDPTRIFLARRTWSQVQVQVQYKRSYKFDADERVNET